MSLLPAVAVREGEELRAKAGVFESSAGAGMAEASDSTTTSYTERYIRSRFANYPRLIDIARCESSFRQNSAAGRVLLSYTDDKGVFQINSQWANTARQLGDDLNTLKGNADFAQWLYEQWQEGKIKEDPWQSSAHCWEK